MQLLLAPYLFVQSFRGKILISGTIFFPLLANALGLFINITFYFKASQNNIRN